MALKKSNKAIEKCSRSLSKISDKKSKKARKINIFRLRKYGNYGIIV
jgi:hypothetical protein